MKLEGGHLRYARTGAAEWITMSKNSKEYTGKSPGTGGGGGRGGVYNPSPQNPRRWP